MVHCPYCKEEMRSNAALSSHLRGIHSETWKGSIGKSIPEGYDVGQPEPRKKIVRKSKWVKKIIKQPIQQKHIRSHIDFCPSCGANIKAFELAAGFVR